MLLNHTAPTFPCFLLFLLFLPLQGIFWLPSQINNPSNSGARSPKVFWSPTLVSQRLPARISASAEFSDRLSHRLWRKEKSKLAACFLFFCYSFFTLQDVQFVLFQISYKRQSVQQRDKFRRQKVLNQEVVLKVVGFIRNTFISSCMSPVMPERRLNRPLRLNCDWSGSRATKTLRIHQTFYSLGTTRYEPSHPPFFLNPNASNDS